MRKIYFFGIGILLVCLAGWGIHSAMRAHANTAEDQAVASLDAGRLYTDFLNSEPRANKRWVGKVIEITGTVSSVNENGRYVSVNLKATGDGGINCSFLKEDLRKEEQIKAGDPIIIKGKCTGFLMDVNMVDCVVKK